MHTIFIYFCLRKILDFNDIYLWIHHCIQSLFVWPLFMQVSVMTITSLVGQAPSDTAE